MFECLRLLKSAGLCVQPFGLVSACREFQSQLGLSSAVDMDGIGSACLGKDLNGWRDPGSAAGLRDCDMAAPDRRGIRRHPDELESFNELFQNAELSTQFRPASAGRARW